LFIGFGCEVELTRRTRDGGKDIIAIRRKEIDIRLLISASGLIQGIPSAFPLFENCTESKQMIEHQKPFSLQRVISRRMLN
jgi:hypothetical protein